MDKDRGEEGSDNVDNDLYFAYCLFVFGLFLPKTEEKQNQGDLCQSPGCRFWLRCRFWGHF